MISHPSQKTFLWQKGQGLDVVYNVARPVKALIFETNDGQRRWRQT